MRSLIAALFLPSLSLVWAAEQNLVGADPVESARREFQEGKLGAALAILDGAGKRAIDTGQALDLRGCILMEQQKFEEAIQSFRAARGKDDAKSEALLHIGDALRRQGKWEEAREAYLAALRETNILMMNERLRFAVLMTRLGAKDEGSAQQALAQLPFPTETAAYYYGQAAWAFAHGAKRDGQKWMGRAEEIFPAKSTAWFARHLFDFGWLKSKPPLVVD